MTDQEIITIESKEIALTEMRISASALTGQIAGSSARVYINDMEEFNRWLAARGLNHRTVDRSAMIAYRQYLVTKEAMHVDTFKGGRKVVRGLGHPISKTTAARMFGVACRVLDEAVNRGELALNPAETVKNLKGGADATPHTALTRSEVKEMLAAIDLSSLAGKRDYAILMLLIKTELRRGECAAFTLGDLKLQQGYHTLSVKHGKGDKARTAKVSVDVMRAINDYLDATDRKKLRDSNPGAALFVRIRKVRTEKLTEEPLSEKGIESIVKARSKAVGINDLTLHGLRATFVTLSLEGGAKLEQVQYAAGHADPRTTERYQKRKLNLDDNASDYIKL